MRTVKKSIVYAVAMALSLTSASLMAWDKDKTYKITILHTNDHHGHFWHNDIGEYGLAAQKTLVDQVRNEVNAEGGSVLLLSGGDINTGVPESDLQNAEPDFRGMSLIGYDAMAVGNHEFDNPIDVLRQQEGWSSFPLLSANIYDKATGKRLFKPYALFDKQGIKIAVLGLTTDDTPRIGDVNLLKGFEFRSPAAEAKQVVEELRKTEKPDIIIAATHMGHYEDGQHGSNAPGDVEMARTLPAGYLDMIVGGHSQNPVCMSAENQRQQNYIPGTACAPDRQNGTWIVQAHEWGKYVGRADFEFRNGEFKLVSYQLIPINLMKEVAKDDGTKQLEFYTQKIDQNADMMKLLTPFQEKGQEKLMVKVGNLTGRLEGDRSVVRHQQTNMGRLILASHIERTNADFGIISGGAVRDSMIEGNITYRDVLKVQPFSNTVVYADLKGKDVLDYLAVVANMKAGSGAYAQLANVSLIADGTGVSDVKIKGEPLDPNKTYRIVAQSFNAAGGDGYPALNQLPTYVDTGFMDAEVVKQYFQTHSPIKADDYQPKGEIVKK